MFVVELIAVDQIVLKKFLTFLADPDSNAAN
jgi:hypothetical protein